MNRQAGSPGERVGADANELHLWAMALPRGGRARSESSVRHVLSRYLGVEPGAIGFETGRNGKPSLRSGVAGGPAFNASHVDGLCVVAVTMGVEVGVDIERVRVQRDLVQVAETHFANGEAALIRGAGNTEQARLFHEVWTRREACIKGVGGVLDDMRTLPAVLTEGESTAAWRKVDVAGRVMWVRSLECGDELAAAVAVERPLEVVWKAPVAAG